MEAMPSADFTSADFAAKQFAAPEIPQDLDQLPKHGVIEFVDRLARAHGVVYERSKLDDWAEAVTRAAGDDVRLDQTEELLLVLRKLNLLTSRQASRLMVNHMREMKDVRSVRGLQDGRVSP
jgi:hypothetical protein